MAVDPKKKPLYIALGVLGALVVLAVATWEGGPGSEGSASEAEAEPTAGAPLDCKRVRGGPEALAKGADPRPFAEAYLCAWKRGEGGPMKKTTLSPDDLDAFLRPTVGPETADARRQAVRGRVIDAYLHLEESVANLHAEATFIVDDVEAVPEDVAFTFADGVEQRMLLFRVRMAGEEEALRTVLARANGGPWKFVPGLAAPEPPGGAPEPPQ